MSRHAAGRLVSRPVPLRAVALLALALSSCGGATPAVVTESAPRTDAVWVVAPHPDDEVLMATEALREAIAEGRRHEVVIVTNGDFTCSRDGWARQRESVAALGAIGVTEAHVHFLGYPDGWLASLGEGPLPELARTAEDGACGTGTGTYGRRGAEGRDVHTARTGAPGAYTAAALVDDLVHLFTAHPPSEIHVPHALDTHPDHAMTYAFVRRALNAMDVAPPLVRHVVHVGGPCWPATDEAGACVPPSPALDATPLPPLPPPLGGYLPDRVLASDAALRRAAIGHYTTQLEAPLETSWLASFARTTEHGWTQRLVRRAGRLEPSTEAPGRVEADTWTAPVALTGPRPVLGGERGYAVRREPGAVVLVRRDGEETVLRAMAVPDGPTEAALTLLVVPRGAHAELEVHGPEGFVLGAVDAAPILAGAGAEGVLQPLP
jgi:LmbE family N-acetylglucosaminyl deacetylase